MDTFRKTNFKFLGRIVFDKNKNDNLQKFKVAQLS